METFSAAWLALREPADLTARSTALVAQAAEALTGRPGGTLGVFDLGAGAGSNLRYLLPRLEASQHWHLLDHDAVLLDAAVARTRAWATAAGFDVLTDDQPLTLGRRSMRATIATQPGDLATLNDAVFRGADADATLVTGAALLDLTSEAWMNGLATRCATAGAVVLFALTYDGRIACDPADADDDVVRVLVNRHQRTDKGFGVAAGPDATAVAAEHFRANGYAVHRAMSDWRLEPDAAALQRELVDGWAHAATDMSPRDRSAILAWRDRRLAHIDGGRSRIVVGHEDLAGWPAGREAT